MWYIYTMESYAAIKNDKLVSFVGTWINLETIILSKLTQEQKNQTPHVLTHKWVLNNENTWTQGGEHHTQGHEIPNVDDGIHDQPPWHVYTYVTNLHILHLYPRI